MISEGKGVRSNFLTLVAMCVFSVDTDFFVTFSTKIIELRSKIILSLKKQLGLYRVNSHLV